MSTLKLEHIAHIDNSGPDISIDSSGHLNIVNGNLQMGGVTMLDASTGSLNATGIVTAVGGNTNNTDDAAVFKGTGTEHIKLLLDTSSTGGHRASVALESNSNEVNIATTGSDEMRFSTANTSDALFIKSDGNVGIGTSSPSEKLHIKSGGNAYKMLILESESGAGDAGILLQGQSGNQFSIQQYANQRGLFFYDRTAGQYRLSIDPNGNVGIGTTNPTGKLHVYDSGTMDINLVGNPPELNLEDTSSSSGTKRARLTVDNNRIYIQGLSDDDQSITHTFLRGDLSNGDLYLENVNGHQLSHRNLINNGGMQIAQRNASYTITSNGYQYNCLDRWGNYYDGTTVGQQEQIVFNQLKKVMRITATTSASNLYTFQWIENGGKILCNGERFSISFKARSSVASGKTCTVQMRYGNAGAGNTAQSDTIGSAALTNSFQQFRFENVDASSFNYTQAGLWLWMPGPSLGDYIEITDVQIELGSNATQFEQKSIAQEMNDCMRFYQRLQGNRDGSGGAAGDRGVFHMHNWGTTNWYGIHHFNVPMRTGPTLKTGFTGTYLGSWFSGGNIGDATSIQIQNSNPWRAELSGGHNNSFLQGGSCWLRLDSDNNYIAFDAEHI